MPHALSRIRLIALAIAALMAAGPAEAKSYTIVAKSYTIVSTPATNSLTVIELSRNRVVASVSLGGLPTGCAVDGDMLYAALSQSNALAIVDLKKGRVRSIGVGAGPVDVAVGGPRRVYVANAGADSVSVVDPHRGTLVTTIPVGDGPVQLAIDGKRLYVANSGDATVSVIDTRDDSVLATIPVGALPAGLAVSHRKKRLFVANFFDDTVSVVDTKTLSVVSTWPVARRPRGLALDKSGRTLFVAGFEDARVQAIDTRTGSVLREEASGGLNPLDLLLGQNGKQLYVAHLQEEEGVVALDADTLAPVASVGTPAGPLAFAGLTHKKPRLPSASAWARASRLLADARLAMSRAATVETGNAQPLASEIVISDGTFNLTDWAVTGSGEHLTTQEIEGGNPGAWRRTTHAGPETSSHLLVRPGAFYNPANQGAIQDIDVSWDRRIFAETLVSERFLVEQDNVVYRTVERTFFSPAWQTDTRTGLGAADFDDGNGNHPDFSAAGAPLRFGYSRQTAFNQTVPHGIDNFAVTVFPGDVNEPRPSVLAFTKAFEVVEEMDSPFVFVERLRGAQGAVSVDVQTERPDGSTVVETLSWPDGDSTPRSILVVLLTLPDGSGARTARLTLLNPTGGATIHPTRDKLTILVFPEQWPAVLRALFLQLFLLLGAFSPVWLVLLAVPVLVAARRSRRARGAARSPHT